MTFDAETIPADDRELVTWRVIDAPRDQVFEAFSDPSRLERWWGPKGFTNRFSEFELRPGGAWRFVMHSPNGVTFPNESVFVDVAPPERVVFRHLSTPEFQMTLTFSDKDGKTLVGWRQLFNTSADRERVARVAVEANEQNLDRLEDEIRRG